MPNSIQSSCRANCCILGYVVAAKFKALSGACKNTRSAVKHHLPESSVKHSMRVVFMAGEAYLPHSSHVGHREESCLACCRLGKLGSQREHANEGLVRLRKRGLTSYYYRTS